MYSFRIDPDALEAQDDLLYFEKANSTNSQFHASDRNLHQAKNEVTRAAARLGGVVIQFIPVIFDSPERFGFVVEYVFRGGAMGQFPVAALPIQRVTDVVKKRAQIQALLIAADIFDASANAQRHIPLSNPLLLHLLVDGEQTIAQVIAKRQALPEQFLLPKRNGG